MTSLLTDPVDHEREAEQREPRPGWVMFDTETPLRVDQDDTERLIASELLSLAMFDEVDDLTRLIGSPMGIWVDAADTAGPGYRQIVQRQRGGISTDPLVRVLAYRAWGDRDHSWINGPRHRADVISVVSQGFAVGHFVRDLRVLCRAFNFDELYGHGGDHGGDHGGHGGDHGEFRFLAHRSNYIALVEVEWPTPDSPSPIKTLLDMLDLLKKKIDAGVAAQ